MNDTFNFKRFGKFLSYDLNNAKGSYGMSLLITGMMPVIIFFFYELFSVLFDGGVHQVPLSLKIIGLVCLYAIFIVASPSKIYGHLTEKRKGADWIMIPASPLEKTLTMVIILCIVVPAVLCIEYSCLDYLLAAVFPSAYGHSLCSHIASGFNGFEQEVQDLLEITTVESIFNEFASTFMSVLSFTLGAICFRKNKIGKTILCLFAFFIVLSMLIVFFFGHGFSFTSDDLERLFSNLNPEKVEFWIRFIGTAVEVLILGGLITAIYFRIKTIKH